MNTYEGHLRESIAQSLAALNDQDAELRHGRALAQSALYHAKGAALAAGDRFEHDRARRDSRHRAYRAVQRAHRAASRLQGNLALSQQGSDSAIGNAATTAGNLQASGTAVVELASTVGAALNVASAALYHSELFHQLTRINTCLNQVANQTVYLAQQAMEVSVLCAESNSGHLTAPGDDLRKRLDDLQSQIGNDLAQDEAEVQAGRQRVTDATQVEGLALGTLRDADGRTQAMAEMLRTAIRQANFDLDVSVVSSSEIRLRFSAFQPPFAPDSVNGLPDPQARTHLAIVPRNRADAFDNDHAAQLFAQWGTDEDVFIPVTPGENTITLRQDVYGSAIRPGHPYCAFLRVDLGNDYKRCFGRQADVLSVASTPFVPLTLMPEVYFCGTGETPEQWFLAWPAQGQVVTAVSSDELAVLFAGAARLTPKLEWLAANGAAIDPHIALKLDSVVPPFGDVLQIVIDALKAKDHKAAATANTAAQQLLALQRGWPMWNQETLAFASDVAELRALLEELGALMARACAPAATAPDKPSKDDPELLPELRCILLDHALDPEIADRAARGECPDIFTLSAAEQIAPANYIVAERLSARPEGATPPQALADQTCVWYALKLESDATDNFGNALLPGHSYTPFVLAITRSVHPQGWGNRLSAINHVWQAA